jgi:hypothetical protein
MPTAATLRRLIDLPGIKDLEYKALLKPRYAEPEARAEFPEVDEVSMAIFGITQDVAEATPHAEALSDIDGLSAREQADAFETQGWDVTDDKRRPLRILPQFAPQLWLAIHGVVGKLPFQAEKIADPMKSSLADEAARFRRDRR